MKKGLLFAFLGFVGYKLVTNINGVKGLEYGFEKLSVNKKQISLSNLTSNKPIPATVNFTIYNPSTKPVGIDNFYGDLSFKGTKVSNIDLVPTKKIMLEARKSTSVAVSLGLPIQSFGSELINYVKASLTGGKVQPISMVVAGKLKLDGVTLPVNQKIDLA